MGGSFRDEGLEALRGRHPLEHAEHLHRQRLGRLDRLALRFTDLTGDARFLGALALGALAWILWNSAAPRPWRFDPAPAFPILQGAGKLLPLLFMPLIMMGQRLQARRSKAQSDAAHRAALRAADETSLILARLAGLEARMPEGKAPPEGSPGGPPGA